MRAIVATPSRFCLVLSLLLMRTAAAWEEPGRPAPVFNSEAIAQLPVRPASAALNVATVANLQPADPAMASMPDPSLVGAGQSAFVRSCTACHDEQRALQKRKTYGGWLATVQRMASKDGADINTADVAPIAAYLTSVAGAEASSGIVTEGGWNFATTISTLHRSASDEYLLENPGFFADVWVTAGYQSTGPWRGDVTACTSCHARDNGGAGNAFGIELLEGSATLDLRHMFHGCRCDDGRELSLKMGRFVVPFGAFAAMSNPAVNRTVTNPLMFNMGRRVLVTGAPPLQPVLPLPFADEGIDLMYRTPIADELMFTFDLYGVNGLQGVGPNIFNRSRAYFDNNEDPSGGARLTLGADYFRVGTSVLTGNLQDQNLPRVYYTLAGVDVTSQISDRLRFYFEYAQRRQNFFSVPDTKETTSGIVTQLELRIWDHPNIYALVSYDTLEHRNRVINEAILQRFTSGFNVGLPGGSLLIINHERWMPKVGEDTDVFGVRWSVSL